MKARDLLVIGGGEHACVLIEAAKSRRDLWNVIGFVDPQPCESTAIRCEIPRLGDDATGFKLSQNPELWCILGVGGIGDVSQREEIAKKFSRNHKINWATVVHSQAWVSPSVELKPGAAVFAGALVNSGAMLGLHSIINTGAIIEHDVNVGDFAHVGPGAAIGGGTVIGANSYLGLGCRVRDHIQLGRKVTVGMGAVVVESIPDEQMVVGSPAKPLLKTSK